MASAGSKREPKSIDEWNQLQKDKNFHEEISPPEHDKSGGLKVRNPDKPNHEQRTVVHVSDKKSKFQKTVAINLCVHGVTDGEGSKPLSLIVLWVHLGCSKSGGHISETEIWFEYESVPGSGTEPPRLVTYAPFNTEQRTEFTEEDRSTTTNVGATVGAEQSGAKADLSAGREWVRSFKQRCFAKAFSDPIWNEKLGRRIGAKWSFQENQSQETGVQPNFHLAMLVEPAVKEIEKVDETGQTVKEKITQPFIGQFDIRVEAGFWENLKRRTKDFFRQGKYEDEPVLFNPALPPKAEDTGLNAIKMVEGDKEHLGKYVGDGLLRVIGAINKVGIPDDNGASQGDR